MWAIRITNADCSRLSDDGVLFDTELDLFETLKKDFDYIQFIEENEHGILYRLRNIGSSSSVYVIVYELEK